MMSQTDGVEVSRRLRADPDTTIIPIIAVSAQQRLSATRGVLPVDERLPKPFEPRQLYETVAQSAAP